MGRFSWNVLSVLLLASFLNSVDVGSCENVTKTLGIARNETEAVVEQSDSNVGNESVRSSARESRQLWSLVKNVIKSSLDEPTRPKPVSGGLSSIASLFGGSILGSLSNGMGLGSTSSNLNQNPSPHQFANPNDYMHYLLLNSQTQQHTSLPHYHQQQQQQMEASTSSLINQYQEEMSSPSKIESASKTGNQILSKLAIGSILDDFDLDKMTNFLSFGTFERMVEKVSKFDRLKCIPRLLCQMVAKRQEDARTTTTTTTTSRPKKVKRKTERDGREDVDNDEDKGDDDTDNDDASEENDDDNEESEEERVVIKQSGSDARTGKFLNVQGADTALEQFVKFLEIMQLKDWALYPYLQGAYQGSQVTRSDDCASRFSSCPFSDEQLVYYFNNYNGGFFQSI